MERKLDVKRIRQEIKRLEKQHREGICERELAHDKYLEFNLTYKPNRKNPTEEDIRKTVENNILWNTYINTQTTYRQLVGLYSLISHMRGKLHMTKLNGSTLQAVTGRSYQPHLKTIVDERRNMISWSLEEQAELVEPLIEQYTLPESL